MKAIKELDPSLPLSYALRDLEIHEQGPWKKIAKRVRVSFPGDHIPKGHAAVCRTNEEYFRRDIQLVNVRREDRMVKVIASLPINNGRCITREESPDSDQSSNTLPLIQISPSAAQALYGEAPLGRFEEAFATVSSPNDEPILPCPGVAKELVLAQ